MAKKQSKASNFISYVLFALIVISLIGSIAVGTIILKEKIKQRLYSKRAN